MHFPSLLAFSVGVEGMFRLFSDDLKDSVAEKRARGSGIGKEGLGSKSRKVLAYLLSFFSVNS